MRHIISEVSAANLDMAVKVLDIAIAVGRYILPLTVAFTLLSLAAAINSFATGSIAGTGFWGILAFIGAVFAAQIVAKRRERRRARPRKMQHRTEFAGAAHA